MNQRASADLFQSDMRQATAAVMLVAVLVFMVLPLFNLPCFFEALTSVPSPLCGGTQALVLLFSGNPLVAMHSNPAATLLVGAFVLAVLGEIVTRHLQLARARQGYESVRAYLPAAVAVVTGVSWFWLVFQHVTT